MLQKGEFVKLNYTGKLADGRVFDTTIPDVAKKAGLQDQHVHPVTLCIGEGMLLPGLDNALIGKADHFTVTLQPEHAFGKKDAKLLKIVPTTQLHQHKINPYPGLELTIDGNYGVVRSVSSGRTVVDFNHPLAGQEVTYDVTILSKIDDHTEQVHALLAPLRIPVQEIKVHEHNVLIKLPQLLPQPIMEALQDRIIKLTSLKTVSFEQGTPNKKETA